jgi:putative nucleotidyltransferase with HDIG domain
MITRDRALKLLHENLKTENLRKHCLASGAVMKAVAQKLGQPAEDWEILGLLHDMDLDKVGNDMKKHALVAAEMLEKEDLKDEYLHAIKAHNEETGFKRESTLDHALAASESITGLIVACALVYPDKKISSVKVKSIKKRMKEKGFARSVSRENIRECEKIGIELPEFIEISLQAMSQIQDQLIN